MLVLLASRVFRAGDLCVRVENSRESALCRVLNTALVRGARLSRHILSACLLSTAIAVPASADTLEYTYDALGRLIQVDRSDGTQTF